jgi:hypothetical protein
MVLSGAFQSLCEKLKSEAPSGESLDDFASLTAWLKPCPDEKPGFPHRRFQGLRVAAQGFAGRVMKLRR